MPVKDLARSDVVSAVPETPVTDLAATMAVEDVGSIVITEGDTPVGIVTDRDLAVRVLAEEADPAELAAADVMTDDVVSIAAEDGFYGAATTMADHGIRRLPVQEDGALVGILTVDDLTELLADEEQHLADILRAQRPAY